MPNFAEGGSVEAQMQELSVDPVSGNEVPPGSLPEEVRDDVDAKLSEGEYVVPADVVRFFGVDYFEKLRKKAKEGLAQMDADGRIGGEPIEEEGDDLPFSDDELATLEDEPVEMAEGGVVEGFAEGFEQEMTSPSVVTELYRNDQGEERTIMFVNGQPIQKIPTGFTKVTDNTKDPKEENQEANREPEHEGGMSTDATDSGFGNDAGTATGGFADAMAGAMDSAIGGALGGGKGIGGALGGLGGIGGALGGIGSAIGGAISGAFGGGNSGGSGGASGGGSSGDAGVAGYGGGYGGYAARGMLVDKRVRQKQKPKPEGKGLVKRKPKSK